MHSEKRPAGMLGGEKEDLILEVGAAISFLRQARNAAILGGAPPNVVDRLEAALAEAEAALLDLYRGLTGQPVQH